MIGTITLVIIGVGIKLYTRKPVKSIDSKWYILLLQCLKCSAVRLSRPDDFPFGTVEIAIIPIQQNILKYGCFASIP